MANDVVRRLAQTEIDLAFADRDLPLVKQRQEITTHFARHGTLQSSMHARQILELYEAEVGIRGALILQAYRRACSVNPVLPGHEPTAEAKAFLIPLLDKAAADLQAAFTELFKGSSIFRGQTLDPALDRATKRLLHEAEIMEAAMAAAKTSKLTSGTHITVHGNQNIVQSGSAGAMATMVLDAGSKAALANALKSLREALAALPGGSMTDRAQTLEVVQEAEAELTKPEPNKLRLISMIKGAAETVRTVAALKPAYEAVKGALAWIGIEI